MIELVHVHIPKCAGMSVRAVLRERFGEALVGTPICNTGSELLRFLDAAGHVPPESEALRDRAAVAVTGHAPWAYVAFARWNVQYVVPVRDPVERVHSWFRFCRGQTCLTPERMLATGQAGLHGWRLDNVITRFVGGLSLDSPQRVGAGDVAEAARRVRKAGSAVRVLTIADLDAWAGLAVPRENVSEPTFETPRIDHDHPWVRWDVRLLDRLGVA